MVQHVKEDQLFGCEHGVAAKKNFILTVFKLSLSLTRLRTPMLETE